jgi:hypothetical protein
MKGFQFSLYLCSCSEVQTNIDYEKNIAKNKAMTVKKNPKIMSTILNMEFPDLKSLQAFKSVIFLLQFYL